MGLITTQDLRKGSNLELEGQPCTVVDMEKHSPTARGGKTLIRVKVRNLLTGQLLEKAFKAGDTFPEPDLDKEDTTYSYATSDAYVFMNTETYEQTEVDKSVLGDEGRFLSEGLTVKLRRYKGSVIAADLPQYVDARVSSVIPAGKGDTARGSVTTEATLDNGVAIQVPLYIKAGDLVRVDPRTGEFRERAV